MASVQAIESETEDYFELAEAVAKSFHLSPADWVRFHTLRLALLDRGIQRSDPRVIKWVSPILCRAADHKLQLERLAVETASSAPVEVGPYVVPEVEQETASASWPRWVIGAAAVSAAIALAVALWPEPPPSPEPDSDLIQGPTIPVPDASTSEAPTQPESSSSPVPAPNPVAESEPASTPAPAPIPSPPPESGEADASSPDTQTGPTPDTAASVNREWQWNPLGRTLALLPWLIVSGYVLWLRSRRRQLKRRFTPPPETTAKIDLDAGVAHLNQSDSLRQSLRKLRQHTLVPGREIDVTSSIRATIAAAGSPKIRFGGRMQTPEYLYMTESEDPADHLALFARSLGDSMRKEGVAFSEFEFLGVPATLRPLENDEIGNPVHLDEVAARHPDARPILFQEGFDCVDGPLGQPWFVDMGARRGAVNLNPRSQCQWDNAESHINHAGFFVAELNPSSLDAYVEHLGSGEEQHPNALKGIEGQFDLAESLALDRQVCLSDKAPSQHTIDDLIDDLSDWLSEEAMDWLRAVALFPRIEPQLTILLGEHMRDASGAPLLTDERFLALARLPWLRSGRMPDWLRRPLVNGLSESRLAEARGVIAAFMRPMEKTEEDGKGARPRGQVVSLKIAASEDVRLQKQIARWLEASPEAMLHDQILLDTMRGKKPDELGVEAPVALVRQAQRLFRSAETRAVVIAALASMLALYLVPPGQWIEAEALPEAEEESPPDATEQPAPPILPENPDEGGAETDEPKNPDFETTNPQAQGPGSSVQGQNPVLPDCEGVECAYIQDHYGVTGSGLGIYVGVGSDPFGPTGRNFLDRMVERYLSERSLGRSIVGGIAVGLIPGKREYNSTAADVIDAVEKYLTDRGVQSDDIDIGEFEIEFGDVPDVAIDDVIGLVYDLGVTTTVTTSATEGSPALEEQSSPMVSVLVNLNQPRLYEPEQTALRRVIEDYRSLSAADERCPVEIAVQMIAPRGVTSDAAVNLVQDYFLKQGIPGDRISVLDPEFTSEQVSQPPGAGQNVALQGGGVGGFTPSVEIRAFARRPACDPERALQQAPPPARQ